MDKCGDFGSGERSIEALCNQLTEKVKEIAVREKLYCSTKDGERELDSINKSISEGKQKLTELESEIQRKSREHIVMMKKFEAVAELKEHQLFKSQKRFERCVKDSELKQEELNELQSRVEKLEKEIESKEEVLKSVDSLVAKRSGEVELKEKRLVLLQSLNRRNSETCKRMFESCARESEMYERKLSGFLEDIELKEEFLSLKLEELSSVENNVKECFEGLCSRETQMFLLQSSVKELGRDLEAREKDLERRVDEFEAKQKSTIVEINSIPYTSSKIPQENKNSAVLLSELLKRYDLVYDQIIKALQSSVEPEMLALRSFLKDNASQIDPGLVRRYSILLSEVIVNSSQNISPRVREFTVKLAQEWKAKMNGPSVSCSEVWAFLQFLLGYKLTSEFDEQELQGLLDVLGLDIKATESSRPSICVVDKDPESIEKLIKRGEIIHAVRHICALKLTDKFPSAKLLTELLDNANSHSSLVCKGKRSWEKKKKAVDSELVLIEAVFECIRECNIGDEFPSDKYSNRISDLNSRKILYSVHLDADQSKKRGNSAFNHRDQAQQAKMKTRRTELNSCSSSRPVAPFHVWEKPPVGFVKLNFGYFSGADHGLISVIARDHNGKALDIWYRKKANLDSLMGNAMASHFALTLAHSYEWRSVHIEGDSHKVIDYLRGTSKAPEAISRVVSESIGLAKSFERVSFLSVNSQVNVFAKNVCRWASMKDITDESTWTSMQSSLVSMFESTDKSAFDSFLRK